MIDLPSCALGRFLFVAGGSPAINIAHKPNNCSFDVIFILIDTRL
jgi:hypothetical protein